MSTRQDFQTALYDLAQAPGAEVALGRLVGLFGRVLDLAADGHHDQAEELLDDYQGLLHLSAALPSWDFPEGGNHE